MPTCHKLKSVKISIFSPQHYKDSLSVWAHSLWQNNLTTGPLGSCSGVWKVSNFIWWPFKCDLDLESFIISLQGWRSLRSPPNKPPDRLQWFLLPSWSLDLPPVAFFINTIFVVSVSLCSDPALQILFWAHKQVTINDLFTFSYSPADPWA